MAMDRVQNNNSFVGSNPGNLPPGFRFHPTDEELILHYLKKKAASNQIPVPIIAEIDLYKFDPWDLPAKAAFGEREWYFFSPRDRKYPNGARPNRAAASGYWKATGTDKPIFLTGSTQPMGVKKALVFYKGRPPKGIKTSWIMHEYRLSDSGSSTSSTVFGLRKGSMRLDDWVLCRIYKKKKSEAGIIRRERDDDVVDELAMQPQEQKPFIMPREGGFGGFNQQDSEFPVLNSFFPDENSEYTGMLNEGYPTKEQNIPSTPTLSSVDVKALDSLKRTLSLNYMDDVAPPSKRSSGGNASTSINMNFTTNSSNSQLQSQSQQIPFFLNGSQPNSYQFPQRLLMTSPSMEDFQQLFRATFAAQNRQQ